MLNKACAVHPVNICQRDGFLVHLIDAHVDEADVVVEAVTEDYRRYERDDCERVEISLSAAFVCSFGEPHVPKQDFKYGLPSFFGRAESRRR